MMIIITYLNIKIKSVFVWFSSLFTLFFNSGLFHPMVGSNRLWTNPNVGRLQ